ncbi:MAG: DUF645 family protein [Flavobacteriaceae bacterium]|nr:DUF645 family protein [Flavobacteriaceae bacterium]
MDIFFKCRIQHGRSGWIHKGIVAIIWLTLNRYIASVG